MGKGETRSLGKMEGDAGPDSVKFEIVVKSRGVMLDDLLREDEKLDSILESVRSWFI